MTVRNRRSSYIFCVLLAVSGVVLALTFDTWRYVLADPLIYRERMMVMIGDGRPYANRFEHLPVNIIPMLVAWVLGGSSSRFTYALIWTVLTTLALLVVVWLLGGMERRGQSESGHVRRWLVAAGPLIPFVIFRNDPIALVFAVAAWALTVTERSWLGGLSATLGALAKGWPVVLAWMVARRSRSAAVATVLTTSALLVPILLSDGFRAGRSFTGIHSETLVGGILGLASSIGGGTVELASHAGATYLTGSPWLPVLNAVPSVAVMLLALIRLRGRSIATVSEPVVVSAMVVVLIMASPLQSAQFLLWPTPFIAAIRSRLLIASTTLISALGLYAVVCLDHLLDGVNQGLWFGAVVTRNVVMGGVGTMLVLRASSQSLPSDSTPSAT